MPISTPYKKFKYIFSYEIRYQKLCNSQHCTILKVYSYLDTVLRGSGDVAIISISFLHSLPKRPSKEKVAMTGYATQTRDVNSSPSPSPIIRDSGALTSSKSFTEAEFKNRHTVDSGIGIVFNFDSIIPSLGLNAMISCCLASSSLLADKIFSINSIDNLKAYSVLIA